MLKKLDEIKVLKDPVHGYIHIEYQLIWDCVNAREFQRLRRIRQLGGAFQVYHTAEHTRFSHSLGVYEIVRKMIEEVKDLNKYLDEYEQLVALLAGLLHDIGHGPYSHAFETISKKSHEEYTVSIIKGDSEIGCCLRAVSSTLCNDIIAVIEARHPNPILGQLISSQLDADRMDYLLRDAYFTGTKYGEFDLERLIRTIRVNDDRLVVKQSGIHSVEDYIMARYHMYWQVYFHPTGRSFEVILKNLFKRVQYLYDHNLLGSFDVFDAYLKKESVTIEEHYSFDEYACGYGFLQLAKSDDKIANDLANRLLKRNLFKYQDFKDDNQYEQMIEVLSKHGYDETYYLIKDDATQRPYFPYTNDKGKGIWILMDDGSVKEISEASVIVKALVKAEEKRDCKIYYPKH